MMVSRRYAEWCPASLRAQAAKCEADGSEHYAEHYREQAEELTRKRTAVIPARFRTATTTLELGDRGLYLHGAVGAGKTHAAAALALAAIDTGSDVDWLSTTAWLADIRASFSSGVAVPVAADFARADLLVIDDLGAEKPTEWALEQLFALVNGAYENGATVIVTSNLKLSDLSKRVGMRVSSRIAEMCDVVEIGGQDRRLAAAYARKKAACDA